MWIVSFIVVSSIFKMVKYAPSYYFWVSWI